jgi:hypothetical protein
MTGPAGSHELRIVPEPPERDRAAIRLALERATAVGGSERNGRTGWWREGIRANVRPPSGRRSGS